MGYPLTAEPLAAIKSSIANINQVRLRTFVCTDLFAVLCHCSGSHIERVLAPTHFLHREWQSRFCVDGMVVHIGNDLTIAGVTSNGI